MEWNRLFKTIVIVVSICLLPASARAEGLMDIYRYDSSLAWKSETASLLQEVLDRVTRFLRPVSGPISSKFGARLHPILGIVRDHKGIDIACCIGSEVRAALSGEVTFAGWRGGYGRLVALSHSGPFSATRYGHLSKILVKSGDVVRQGDVIALSGQSGLTTGPHLHFEIYKDGKAVNPEEFLGAPVPRQLPIFELFSQSTGGKTI